METVMPGCGDNLEPVYLHTLPSCIVCHSEHYTGPIVDGLQDGEFILSPTSCAIVTRDPDTGKLYRGMRKQINLSPAYAATNYIIQGVTLGKKTRFPMGLFDFNPHYCAPAVQDFINRRKKGMTEHNCKTLDEFTSSNYVKV